MLETEFFDTKTPEASEQSLRRFHELTDGLLEWAKDELPAMNVVAVSGLLQHTDQGKGEIEGKVTVQYLGRPRAAASMLGAALAQIVRDVWKVLESRAYTSKLEDLENQFLQEFFRAVAAGFLPNISGEQADMVLTALESLRSSSIQEKPGR